jgi:hypothetical protein
MRYDGITFSQTAVNQVLAEIRNGVTYPDFWEDRYSDEQEEEHTNQEEEKQEKTAQA